MVHLVKQDGELTKLGEVLSKRLDKWRADMSVGPDNEKLATEFHDMANTLAHEAPDRLAWATYVMQTLTPLAYTVVQTEEKRIKEAGYYTMAVLLIKAMAEWDLAVAETTGKIS